MSDRGKGKTGSERRLDERVPAQIRVRLKYPDVETFLERYATNISRGGIFIQTQRTKPPGTLIRFEFQLQDASPVIRGEGRVSWVVPYDAAHAERAYGMGVKFTRLDARSKSYIDRIVVQKAKRGQPDNANAPPQPEEAQLGPVRDVTGQDASTPPKAVPVHAEPTAPAPAGGGASSLAAAVAAAIPMVMTPVLPVDVEELLASGPLIETRGLSSRILGPEPRDLATLERLLGEIDAALAASGHPVPIAPSPAPARPRRRSVPPAAPPAPAAETSSAAPDASPAPPAVGEPSARDQGPDEDAAYAGGATAVEPERPAPAPPAMTSVDERIDRFLDGASPGSFALDLEGMPAPPPLETAEARRTPAPFRRTPAPAPRRRSERSMPAPPPPEPAAAEPERSALALSAAELAAAVSAAAEGPWSGVEPDATEPSVQVPLMDLGAGQDVTPAFADGGGAATVESPPDITPPVAADMDMPQAEAEAASLLGMDDPFGMRGEDDAFSMDVGPLLEDSDGGPPSERTVIGGLGHGFGPAPGAPPMGTVMDARRGTGSPPEGGRRGTGSPPEGGRRGTGSPPDAFDSSLEVTATHPPMPTDGDGDGDMDEVGFFDGDVGDTEVQPEVPPDAGAQAGLPILDEPLVDDFEGPPASQATGSQGLDDAFVFAETVAAEALPEDEQSMTLVGEAMPELNIEEGLLDAAPGEEVTARQSPLPPEPGDEGAGGTDDDQPKKGFFRKLFGNK